MMKIATIVGARPQFIKAAPVSRVLRREYRETFIHTGQHYDFNMSAVFFEELDIPFPDYNLEVGSGLQGWQTGQMLARIEEVLLRERPDCVLVYGDTNSTLAGALAASKLHIKVAHIEAGLRSFNRAMPEELNRVTTDHLSDLLLCPSETAISNLAAEGITRGVHLVGDVMLDALAYAAQLSSARSKVRERLQIEEGGYIVATVHRAENTDDDVRLQAILKAFSEIPDKIIFPVHPRTRLRLRHLGMDELELMRVNIHVIDPLGFLDMVRLEAGARMILTDSGGIQKEAYWLSVPCVTLRDDTEWVETVEAGWNILVGADPTRIVDVVKSFRPASTQPPLYGDGQAAIHCARVLAESVGRP